MIDRLEFYSDDEIKAARSVTLRTEDFRWSQQVTFEWGEKRPELTKPPMVAVIDIDQFDAAVDRIRRLRPDVPGGLDFQP